MPGPASGAPTRAHGASGRRLLAARRRLRERDLAALLVGPGADLRYLLGYDVPASERLTLLVLPAVGSPALIVPDLDEPRARAAGVADHAELHPWGEADDPVGTVAAVVRARELLPGRLAVDDRLWTTFTLRLQRRLGAAEWVAGSTVTGPLRIVKDAAEIDRLREAARAIDTVHARVPEVLAPGRSEAEVAGDLSGLIRRGHDEVAFVIVAAGPDGASPHHRSGDRRIAAGEPVVVDIGGIRDGYCSDATRNYVVGAPPADYAALHEVLQQAQHAGVSAVEPGVRAGEVDAAARRVLTDAGYGEHFVHRTGHGIGLEGHEPPWIAPGAVERLRPGMVFSVEPGVYVPGHHGARIEDVVAVTDRGVERLNTRSRDLTSVAL